jgi:hypothetical protein
MLQRQLHLNYRNGVSGCRLDWINLAEVKSAVKLSCERSNNFMTVTFWDVTPCILVKNVKLSLGLIKHHSLKT